MALWIWCRKLTDSSVKAISENCPNLTVLDLANVCKLTDSSLGYLANGCQALEKLIFFRNSFRQVSLLECYNLTQCLCTLIYKNMIRVLSTAFLIFVNFEKLRALLR